MIEYDIQEELTLKDVLLGVGDYAKELWKKKLLIILLAALGAIYFIWSESKEEVTYKASLTFMLNNDEGSSAGGLASILGSVGLGAGGATEYNLNKIVELSKSQLILQEVLLDSAVVDDKADLLANHILFTYQLPARWEEEGKADWAAIHYTDTDDKNFTTAERKVIQYLRSKIVGTDSKAGFVSTRVDPTTSIMKMQATTISESLSAVLAEAVFNHLSSFYIEKITASPQRTVESLRIKSDSLRQLLSSTEYSLANRRDASLGLIRQRDKVTAEQLSRQVTVLNVIYGEVVKNLATAEFTLSNVTPFFAIIDRPFLPLSRNKPNYLKAGILGAVMGGFIAVLFLGLRKLIRDALYVKPEQVQ